MPQNSYGIIINLVFTGILLYIHRETVKEICCGHNEVDLRKSFNCCSNVGVSSHGRGNYFYPLIMGDYQRSSKSSFYLKTEGDLSFALQKSFAGSNLWIIKPFPKYEISFVRSTEEAPCPSLVKVWKVFDKVRNKWELDKSFAVKCI